MKKKLICCICLKEINKNGDYFRATLFLNGKEKTTDYAHRECKLNQNKLPPQLDDLLKGVTSFAIGKGIIQPKQQEVYIQ